MPRTRKTYKKKRGGYQNVQVTRAPLPRKFTTKLKYVGNDTMNVGATGIPAAHVFRINSIYDPDFTTAGHQPMGFDQIAPLYDHWTVIGCKWKATFSSNETGTTTDRANVCGYMISDADKTSYINGSDVNELMENPEVRSTVVANATGGASTKSISGKINPNKFLGRAGAPLNDDQLKGTISTNPAEQAYVNFFVAPMVSGNDTVSVQCLFELEYIVVFHEPKQLSQS